MKYLKVLKCTQNIYFDELAIVAKEKDLSTRANDKRSVLRVYFQIPYFWILESIVIIWTKFQLN